MLKGVKLLDDLCDRLSRRLDAFEESEKEGWFRDPIAPTLTALADGRRWLAVTDFG